MLKILVTGATGNVGQAVIHLLREQNCQIYAAVRNPHNAQKTLARDIQHKSRLGGAIA
ncbi:NmrA family NAD(P)-binding protein [Nostoc sp. FACHB-110]|uniref:NAD-dependent epimerase/dehydratase family protein n=1 Tax=Nostoc sp. FACHB-110 TaxID=2692834 RepID=UPI001683582C|nr:NmrA family NAD(P)-binding protein [Nostoc sp. FACHB-110]MBD2438888.1 NmrA family NAD(P)-binding protein [Nostoc sp. FACHB-110]